MNSRLEVILLRTILLLLMTGGRSFGREVFEAVPSEAAVISNGGSGSGSGGQRFMREPLDQIAAIGEHVTLPCRVANKLGALQWTRDDFGLGTDRNLSGYKRYLMTGSDEEGKTKTKTKSLKINMSSVLCIANSAHNQKVVGLNLVSLKYFLDMVLIKSHARLIVDTWSNSYMSDHFCALL